MPAPRTTFAAPARITVSAPVAEVATDTVVTEPAPMVTVSSPVLSSTVSTLVAVMLFVPVASCKLSASAVPPRFTEIPVAAAAKVMVWLVAAAPVIDVIPVVPRVIVLFVDAARRSKTSTSVTPVRTITPSSVIAMVSVPPPPDTTSFASKPADVNTKMSLPVEPARVSLPVAPVIEAPTVPVTVIRSLNAPVVVTTSTADTFNVLAAAKSVSVSAPVPPVTVPEVRA